MKSLKLIVLASLGVLALLGIVPAQAQTTTMTVYEPPYGVDVYVRGSFNWWTLVTMMTFDAVENKYVAYREISPGTYEFKVASEDWATVDLGNTPGSDPFVTLDVPKVIAQVGNNNLFLEVTVPGIYMFTFDPSNPANLTLLVERVPEGSNGTVRLTFTQSGKSFWDCLGDASPLTATNTNEITIRRRQNENGQIYISHYRLLDSVVFDQLGREYRAVPTGVAPYVEHVSLNGAYVLNTVERWRLLAQDGGPNLMFKALSKITIGPTGEVRSDIFVYEKNCSE